MAFVPRPPTERRRFVVRACGDATPTVRHIVLEAEDGQPYAYLPGQWIKLYLPGGLERDYSIASAPDPVARHRIELVVTRVEGGPGSAALHAMPPGTVIESLGPSGLFVREQSHRDHPALYVATGTGLAPLRAMLEDERAQPSGQPQVLLFGARTEADLLFARELREEAGAGHLRYEPTLSRAGDGWSGRRGYVQAHLRELVPQLPGAHVYVCGLSRMITDVRAVLKQELGLPRQQVHSERYD